MATTNQQGDTPEHLERVKAGKSGKLFRLEILYYVDADVKKVEISNRYWPEVKEIRQDIFFIGVMVPLDPGRWVIISPGEIKIIYVHRQNGYLS